MGKYRAAWCSFDFSFKTDPDEVVMPSYFPPVWSIIVSVVAVLCAFACGQIKDDMGKFAFGVFTVALAVVAGIGWNANIVELLNGQSRLHYHLTSVERDVKELKAQVETLTPYQIGYEKVTAVALAAPPKELDVRIFQALILNVPAQMTAEDIKGFCKAPGTLKPVLDPLVAQGAVVAGRRQAWDVMINCAATAR